MGRRRRNGVSGSRASLSRTPSQPRPPLLLLRALSPSGEREREMYKSPAARSHFRRNSPQPSSRGERRCSPGPSRYAAPQQQACRNASTMPWATELASRRRRCLQPLVSPPPRRDRPHCWLDGGGSAADVAAASALVAAVDDAVVVVLCRDRCPPRQSSDDFSPLDEASIGSVLRRFILLFLSIVAFKADRSTTTSPGPWIQGSPST